MRAAVLAFLLFVAAGAGSAGLAATAPHDVWWRLFGCESAGTYNPRIVSRSGRYRGAFQFDMQTWHSIGGPGDPIAYSYERQRFYAMKLRAQRGWRPWPTCSRRLGLQ